VLELLVDLASFIIGRVVASTEDALDVLRAVLARAEMGRVRASTFDIPEL
jgi:hypothetical protein